MALQGDEGPEAFHDNSVSATSCRQRPAEQKGKLGIFQAHSSPPMAAPLELVTAAFPHV